MLDASHVKSTGIRIRLFAPFGMSSQSFQHVLKGGDYVRLYHQECNAMLEVVRNDDDRAEQSAGRSPAHLPPGSASASPNVNRRQSLQAEQRERSSSGSSPPPLVSPEAPKGLPPGRRRSLRRESVSNMTKSPLLVTNPWGTKDSFLSDDNTLCLRELTEGAGPVDATNASSLWQVELIQNDTVQAGRPIMWCDIIRLKNVLSEGYLDLQIRTKTGAPGVSYDRSVANFISFEQAVDVEESTVAYSTPIYIRSVHNQWLHATTKASIVNDDVTHRYLQVDFVDAKRDENAFNMQLASLSEINPLYDRSSAR